MKIYITGLPSGYEVEHLVRLFYPMAPLTLTPPENAEDCVWAEKTPDGLHALVSILDATSKKIPTLIEIQTFAEQEGLCVDVQKFYDYYTETGWMTKNQQPITNWKSTLLYWNQSEGTPHKKTKQEEPRSENADIYESLIGRVLL